MPRARHVFRSHLRHHFVHLPHTHTRRVTGDGRIKQRAAKANRTTTPTTILLSNTHTTPSKEHQAWIFCHRGPEMMATAAMHRHACGDVLGKVLGSFNHGIPGSRFCSNERHNNKGWQWPRHNGIFQVFERCHCCPVANFHHHARQEKKSGARTGAGGTPFHVPTSLSHERSADKLSSKKGKEMGESSSISWRSQTTSYNAPSTPQSTTVSNTRLPTTTAANPPPQGGRAPAPRTSHPGQVSKTPPAGTGTNIEVQHGCSAWLRPEIS